MQPAVQAAICTNIRSLLRGCNVTHKVVPFDKNLYQECVNEGVRRGYSMDNDRFLQHCLQVGVVYVATACAHITHRPTQIWIALYTSCVVFVEDVADHLSSEFPNVCLFNNRFISREPQGNVILEAFADIIRRASGLFHPIACQLIVSSTLAFVAANLLEHETKSAKASTVAQEYLDYRRAITGLAEGYAYMAFPQEIPLDDYVQAIPTIMTYLGNVNDILSFYKEEKVGEKTNRICMLADGVEKSKLEALDELKEATIDICKRIEKILERSPAAYEAFEHLKTGYVYFHTSSARYRMRELGL